MGLGMKLLNIKNYRGMVQIAKISNSLDKHMKKRCAYCDNFDMGVGDDAPVVEFVKHLAENHPTLIDPKDITTYEKLIKKLTR